MLGCVGVVDLHPRAAFPVGGVAFRPFAGAVFFRQLHMDGSYPVRVGMCALEQR